jgi:hypothetical protein
MRPRLSHWCRDVFGKAGLLRAIAILFLALGFWQLCGAQQTNPEERLGAWTPLSIEQVRDAASLALPRSESIVDAKLLKVTRRPDLEYLLSNIVQRRGSQGLYLYQVEIPSRANYDGQWKWIVAVAARRQEAYELYSFGSMEKGADVAAEFNRHFSWRLRSHSGRERSCSTRTPCASPSGGITSWRTTKRGDPSTRIHDGGTVFWMRKYPSWRPEPKSNRMGATALR